MESKLLSPQDKLKLAKERAAKMKQKLSTKYEVKTESNSLQQTDKRKVDDDFIAQVNRDIEEECSVMTTMSMQAFETMTLKTESKCIGEQQNLQQENTLQPPTPPPFEPKSPPKPVRESNIPTHQQSLSLPVQQNLSPSISVSPTSPADPEALKRLTTADFEPLAIIGRGAFGEVRLVRKREGDHYEVYAMKSMLKEAMIVKNQVRYITVQYSIV